MKKIAFVTGSRAEYGIVRNYLKYLDEDKNIDLNVIATSALLDSKYGKQIDLIYKDGFKVEKEIKLHLDSSSNLKILQTMSEALSKFAEYFYFNKYDLIIILGDRYEMLSVATAASMQKIPILHIHGGEATFGNYDEFIRHCITKMSLYHFTATEEYRKRVIQLGESPEKVYNLGSLGAENCTHINLNNISEEIKKYGNKDYFVVLFHPETLTNIDVENQIDELLSCLDKYPEYTFVFLGTNSDTKAHIIRKKIINYVEKKENCFSYENLYPDEYHYLLKNSLALIGNSSSGIIEAPSLGIYTINIGKRQDGRVRSNSIIDVEANRTQIYNAMKTIIENKEKKLNVINPYYKNNAAKNYYKTTLNILKNINADIKEPKVFYDIKNMDIQ